MSGDSVAKSLSVNEGRNSGREELGSMILYITVAAVTVLLAGMVVNRPVIQPYTVSRQQVCNRVCLVAIFTILVALSALRLNVGNDYAKYVEFMHLIRCDSYVPTEIGFNLLVKLVYYVSGFENYLLVFGIYAFATVFFFMLAIYEQSEDFAFSCFLFMALGYYFQTFSTVRYYLALALAFYSMKFVLRRQWWRFLTIVLIGACFHKSLLVILPLYVLALVPWKKWQLLLMGLFCTTFLFMQDFYLKVVVFLYPTYEETEYLEGGISYINILRCTGVLIFAGIVYFLEKREDIEEEQKTEDADRREAEENERLRFCFYLNLGALILYVFCSFLPIISRIGYYLTVSQIVYLPMLVRRIKNNRLRKIFRLGVIAAAILYFAMYMKRAGNDGVRILPYQSFLFEDMVDILSDVN